MRSALVRTPIGVAAGTLGILIFLNGLFVVVDDEIDCESAAPVVFDVSAEAASTPRLGIFMLFEFD